MHLIFNDSLNISDNSTFSLEPMGINDLGSIMLKLGEVAGLSNRCTNHSVRSDVTAVHILTKAGLETQ